MQFFLLFILYLLNNLLITNCKDVIGCGGFIKSHVPIDFSKIEMHLYTKQGILKDKTNCAPNNGYYFLPVYDKGEYNLELKPPSGWSFETTSIPIHIDGVTDVCSQGKDVDFIFKGFGITGKVESLGSTNGPKNIEINLIGNGEIIKTTRTVDDGTFSFTPVYPGTYTISVVIDKWKMSKKQLIVQVTEGNTQLPSNSFVILGYNVIGEIKIGNEPIGEATVILFSTDNKKNLKIDNCDVDILSNIKFKDDPICHVKSDKMGQFEFQTVPYGNYYIIPYYKSRHIYFKPNEIKFNVGHDDVKLEENFEIVALTVSGKILKLPTPNSTPIANALIILNGKKITKTDQNGVFKLEKIAVASYNLKIESDEYQFDNIILKISPSKDQLPDIHPVRYQICGHVISDKKQIVYIRQQENGDNNQLITETDSIDGKFCEFLPLGTYELHVALSDDDLSKGLQFFPKTYQLDVGTHKTDDIIFSQLKAELNGRVSCLRSRDCLGLKIILNLNDGDNIVTDVNNGLYRLKNVYPGIYDIALQKNKFCWKNVEKSVNINSSDVTGPHFIQTGYLVYFESSHDTIVLYKYENTNSFIKLDIPKGRSSACFEKSGNYQIKLNGCHEYDRNTFNYNTDIMSEIILNARKHTIGLTIASDMNWGDIFVTINLDDGRKQKKGPLTYKSNGYHLNLVLGVDERAIIIPQSDLLYFNPPLLSVIGTTDCTDLGTKFHADKGRVFKGRIQPPIEGVLISIETNHSETLTIETDSNGYYQFAPLDNTKFYQIKAEKMSYIFDGPDSKGVFYAKKLAEIVVKVMDKSLKPLEGALISLSGSDSYRSNLQTDLNGMINFTSLTPSIYYLKPMMKEYEFEPNSQIIEINEGETIKVELSGKRVAYSVYGSANFLNGEPAENIVIIASGLNNCTHLSEESLTQSNGEFRIRGLQPFCTYRIHVNGSFNEQIVIERHTMDNVIFEDIKEDIRNLRFTIFTPGTHMDVMVKIDADYDYYKNLRLKINRESAPIALLHTIKLQTYLNGLSSDNNPGILIQIPTSFPLDGRLYSAQLESNLPQNYGVVSTEYFNANQTFKYLQLKFRINMNMIDHDIKQTSIWGLLFIFLCIYGFYQIDQITNLLKHTNLFGWIDLNRFHFKPTVPNNDLMDIQKIDQIVENINAVKRKKSKKN